MISMEVLGINCGGGAQVVAACWGRDAAAAARPGSGGGGGEHLFSPKGSEGLASSRLFYQCDEGKDELVHSGTGRAGRRAWRDSGHTLRAKFSSGLSIGIEGILFWLKMASGWLAKPWPRFSRRLPLFPWPRPALARPAADGAGEVLGPPLGL